MKVTLDLTRLLQQGQITPLEFERLCGLARSDTGALGINILIGFGVVSVALGIIALLPDPLTGIVLGLLLLVAGVALLMRLPRWLVLGNVCLLLAALLFGGGLLILRGPTAQSFLLMAAIASAAALAARSALMTTLAVLCLDALLGSSGEYSHAQYTIVIEQPTLTVVLFSLLALMSYFASKRLPAEFERLAIVAARASVFLVNLGFWVGSLWGDTFSDPDHGATAPQVPAVAFAALWAIALVGAGAWAVRANRRWVLNLAAVFAGIAFYTQWFERLGATPISVLAAGVLMLVCAIVLWRWNDRAAALPDLAGGAH